MNVHEHILTVLMEECAEVAKECSKALRFGLDDKVTMNPDGPRGTEGPTNREKLSDELNDLIGVTHMLIHEGILPPEWQDAEKQVRKGAKVARFMRYAMNVGSLQGGGKV